MGTRTDVTKHRVWRAEKSREIHEVNHTTPPAPSHSRLAGVSENRVLKSRAPGFSSTRPRALQRQGGGPLKLLPNNSLHYNLFCAIAKRQLSTFIGQTRPGIERDGDMKDVVKDSVTYNEASGEVVSNLSTNNISANAGALTAASMSKNRSRSLLHLRGSYEESRRGK
jgi:hypothetical protein